MPDSELPPPVAATDVPTALPRPSQTSPRHIMYRLWNGVYPSPVCRSVIDEFDANLFADAGIQDRRGDLVVEPDTRRATNVFIEPGHWTGALVTHFAHQANLVWNYDISGLGTLSLVRYDESGHFDWHVDVLSSGQTQYPELGDGLERKLSVTVNLSDPDDYTGGELEFLDGVGRLLTQPEMRQRGSVVVFPSTLGHRVTPVTSGIRYALVGWMVGPPLR